MNFLKIKKISQKQINAWFLNQMYKKLLWWYFQGFSNNSIELLIKKLLSNKLKNHQWFKNTKVRWKDLIILSKNAKINLKTSIISLKSRLSTIPLKKISCLVHLQNQTIMMKKINLKKKIFQMILHRIHPMKIIIKCKRNLINNKDHFYWIIVLVVVKVIQISSILKNSNNRVLWNWIRIIKSLENEEKTLIICNHQKWLNFLKYNKIRKKLYNFH